MNLERRVMLVFILLALFVPSLMNNQIVLSTALFPSPSPTPPSTKPPVLKKTDVEKGKQSRAPSTESDEQEDISDEGIVRINTTLVTVPVSVMDRDGRYVFDMQREEFRLYENGIEQELAFFASTEMPFTVVLMLDVSDSAIFRIDEVKDAAIAFVDLLRKDDHAIIVAFARQFEVIAESTTDKNVLRNAIRNVSLSTGTSLYNAVDITLKQVLREVPGRKAIVLFTDGADTSSLGATFETNMRDAAESESMVYTVQYDLSPSGKRYVTNGRVQAVGVVGRTQSIVANRYLSLLPAKTGGRQFKAKTVQELKKSFADIAEELRHQYSLGFYPQKPEHQFPLRRIKVRVTRPKLIVRSRTSYRSASLTTQ